MNLIGRSAPFSIRLPRVRSRTFVRGEPSDGLATHQMGSGAPSPIGTNAKSLNVRCSAAVGTNSGLLVKCPPLRSLDPRRKSRIAAYGKNHRALIPPAPPPCACRHTYAPVRRDRWDFHSPRQLGSDG
jgi:hypothetical protein